MMPLYGFLQGDSLGLLILAYENETVEILIEKIRKSARTRVAASGPLKLLFQGKNLDPKLVLKESGIQPLDRVDVVSTIENGKAK